jgi:DNA topoisomerase-2
MFPQKAKPKAAPKKAAAPKAAKVPKEPKAPKAGAKKLVQTTLKTAASKKRPKPESDDEDPADDDMLDASLLSNTPPSAKKQRKAPAAKKAGGKPLADIANESFGMDDGMDGLSDLKPVSKKDATDRYQKLTPLQHIIKRPDTYIGSVEHTNEIMWVFNSESSQMELRKITFVPGLYKIFDEILVNAADNKQNDPTMKQIKVTVDSEKGEISVENDGAGIPVEIHKVRPFKLSGHHCY